MTDTRERIAFRSTRGEGRFAKRRWTEMAIHYDPAAADGNRFIANITGKSDYEGETDRVNETAYHTLALALHHFDDSAPAQSIADQASVWAERMVEQHERAKAAAPAMTIPTDDMGALAMLYGQEATERRGFQAQVARDFGIGESSVRMALKNGTGLKVPLLAIAALIDRAKLAGMQEASRG
jgi:hypothetical protein